MTVVSDSHYQSTLDAVYVYIGADLQPVQDARARPSRARRTRTPEMHAADVSDLPPIKGYGGLPSRLYLA